MFALHILPRRLRNLVGYTAIVAMNLSLVSCDEAPSSQPAPASSTREPDEPPPATPEQVARALEIRNGDDGAAFSANPPPAEDVLRDGICSASGWCWVRPFPQGESLEAVAATATDIVAVGDAGTVVVRHADGWHSEPSGVHDDLHGVWIGAEEWIAVGKHGAVTRRIGTAWSPVPSGVEDDLRGVHGSGTQVFAVGARGRILHIEGARVRTPASPTDQGLVGVWATSPTNAFAVGYEGTLLRYDGTAWQAIDAGTNESLLAIWGANDDFVVAVGSSGTALIWDGNRWNPSSTGSSASLEGVWGTGPRDVYASGGSEIRHFDGSQWTEIASPPVRRGLELPTIDAITGQDDQLFAVGTHGLVLRFEAGAWNRESRGTGQRLLGVACDTTRVVAVGSQSLLIEETGFQIASLPVAPRAEYLVSVWQANDGTFYATGADGVLAQLTGTAWAAVDPQPPRLGVHSFSDLWGAGEGPPTFLVGGGFIVANSPPYWAPLPIERAPWNAIGGSSPDSIFVVVAGGRVMHFDGSAWNAQSTPTSESLNDVWSSSSDVALAVGDKGAIIRRAGESWRSIESPTEEDLYAIGAWDGAPRIIVGGNGTILRWRDDRWTIEESPSRTRLTGVCRNSLGAFIVGDDGTVLRRRESTP